jgi:ribosomal protein S18 acetylase RimI-like enzyme
MNSSQLSITPWQDELVDKQDAAALIWEADQEFNSLVYGSREEALRIISAMMDMEGSYFDRKHLLCGSFGDALAGIAVHYPTALKKQVDQESGKAFGKLIGMKTMVKRIPTFINIGRATTSRIFDPEGGYIHTICVDARFRGRGVGRALTDHLAEQYGSIQLDVNVRKDDSRAFYKAIGFQEISRHRAKIRGADRGTCAMFLQNL